MMGLFTRKPPEPPTDVRVQLIDGGEIPIELAYAGRDGEGQHRWVQVSPEAIPRSQFRSASCAVLPGRTSIDLIFEGA